MNVKFYPNLKETAQKFKIEKIKTIQLNPWSITERFIHFSSKNHKRDLAKI